MIRLTQGRFIEDSYIISNEAKHATYFGIGNGYFGIRGSFEEFGEVLLQGTYVRGVFDQIIENPQPYCANRYMKQYYFDAEKLKEFEYEDSCINIGDIQALRIYIDHRLFLPWNYEITAYERELDYTTGGVRRIMEIKDKEGNRTRFCFDKVCSFTHNHLFLQEIKVEKLNHDLDIEIHSGIDFMVKTVGQKKSVPSDALRADKTTKIHTEFGNKYHMSGDFYFQNEVEGMEEIETKDDLRFPRTVFRMTGRKGFLRKKALFYASIDPYDNKEIGEILSRTYSDLYQESQAEFEKIFASLDVRIEGNEELDALIRYANYQTLIGFDRYDVVHSLSAKNLTSEKYNQFVWWDCEIYQLPYFLLHFPKEARSLLEYRYKCFPIALENAKKEGRKGARFAFCSSVDGEEQVWIYAKHPFLQIHIDSDIAYGILNYYKHTHDEEFLLTKGMKMIENILLYFYSRSTFRGGTYQLLCVTGTDEHHDYVDNDAYTNYEVKYVIDEFLKLVEQFHYELKDFSYQELLDFKEHLYLPRFEGDLLPQFDGYLSLSQKTVLEGNPEKGDTSSFQMKQSALYHLCQTIKQPDVLLLYTYLDIGFQEHYLENYRYYTERCEASSSLTYPVHAIAAIDNGDEERFLADLYHSLRIDLDDLHGGAREGIHAGCLTGGYLALFRGLLGIQIEKDHLLIHPHRCASIPKLTLSFLYQGKQVKVDYNQERMILTSDTPFVYEYKGRRSEPIREAVVVYGKE